MASLAGGAGCVRTVVPVGDRPFVEVLGFFAGVTFFVTTLALTRRAGEVLV
jgi:hypothetical protein